MLHHFNLIWHICVSDLYIVCHFLCWDSGGRATNSPTRVSASAKWDVSLHWVSRVNLFHRILFLKWIFVPILPVTGRITQFASNNTLKVTHKRTDARMKSFRFQGPNGWNQLNSSTKVIENFNEFKSHWYWVKHAF